MAPALKATRGMWKASAMPHKRVRVPIHRTFTKTEFAKLTRGFVPQTMDDRWFIFFEKGWLYFHRSWSGRGFFQLRILKNKGRYNIAEAWTVRHSRHANSSDIESEARLVSILIDDLLLARHPS